MADSKMNFNTNMIPSRCRVCDNCVAKISEKFFEVAEVLGVKFQDVPPEHKQCFFGKHPQDMSRTRSFYLKKMLSALILPLTSMICSYPQAALGLIAENIPVAGKESEIAKTVASSFNATSDK